MLKPTIFREYDIRGVAESELLSPDVEQLGLGLGSYLVRHSGGRKINVGRDCRLSSTRLRDALVKGLRAAGCDVTDIGGNGVDLLVYAGNTIPVAPSGAPGPIAGAGLPGMVLACGGLLAWWRRRQVAALI